MSGTRTAARHGALAALAALAWASPAADPAWYVRGADWRDSLLASVAARDARGLQDGFAPFEGDTLRGGDPAQRIRIPIVGAESLYLFVTGIPDTQWAVADWADARLVRDDGSFTWVSALDGLEVHQGRCEKDLTLKSGLYQKLRLNGRTFDRGLNVQADSALRVPLGGRYAWFEATVGVDDWAGTNGSVRFSVLGARRAGARRLWACLMRDFETGPDRQEMRWEREDRLLEFDGRADDWPAWARRYAAASARVPPLAREAAELAAGIRDRAGVERLRASCYLRSRALADALARGCALEAEAGAPRAALEDLCAAFPGRYPAEWLSRFDARREAVRAARAGFDPERLESWTAVKGAGDAFEACRREALLANPLLDFERLLVLRRVPLGGARRTGWEGYGYGEYLGLPRQSSWNYGTMPVVDAWTNGIDVLSPVRPEGTLAPLYRPPGTRLVNDIELHWDADRLLFSMPDTNRNWQVHELRLAPSAGRGRPAVRQLTPGIHRDVHNYDATYLPCGDIVFLSTAPLQGVPCNASVIVGMMYRMGPDGQAIRQLTFEQDHDYTPSVLPNGRVLYLRWDYTDTPHVWNRLLMSMNPDGTGQMEYIGGNSYWPNAMFYARAIPGHPSKVAAIVTGHHEGRVGELFVFDPAKGRRETDGVVQRIPRRGPPVQARIEDKLTEHSWPKFLHPWPLSEKYFLVAAKPEPDALWGIYLADVFDNLVLVREEEGAALLEPVPLAPRAMPPVIADRVDTNRHDAVVYLEDVYAGPGLAGVPRGTVKALRLFTYHFGYQRLAGIDHRVGADGPWEAKRVLGTVPVEPDGSALFRVPAKTPISLQPLDAEGRAVALMRSWMTAMPGEHVSCVGCHDAQSGTPSGARRRQALAGLPREIAPWRGPTRGFSFAREVQPVLDRHCVGCHDGGGGPRSAAPDLRRDQGGCVVYPGGQLDGEFIRRPRSELLGRYGAVFDPSYVALRAFVRVGGLESDLHLLPPREFGADTSELVRMFAKGHHGVQLDAEAWDRLVTWIDLNAPCHGTWGETTRIPGRQVERRLELRALYGGVVENGEAPPPDEPPPAPLPAPAPDARPAPPRVAGWPFDAAAARALQAAAGAACRTVDLGGGVAMAFVRVPAGTFVMGDPDGAPDERTCAVVRIERPFWMAACETSNEQFARFDAVHDSRFEHRSSWWFDEAYIGWPLNRPRQPVVRVSWDEAMAFCRWLSQRLGETVTLPTEAQWEWACRAGAATPMHYGGLDDNFARFANLGDASLRRLADEGWRPKAPDLVPKEARVNDGALVCADIGSYAPNAWGLHDTHGNAAEWTRSDYGAAGRKAIRGGSWRDRPKLCASASRWGYDAWQKVYNVGFRVVIEPDPTRARPPDR